MNQLIHDPAGRQHPYEAAAFERSPLEPIAGEAVTIGIVARPAGAWRRVWVEWQEKKGTLQRAEATLIGSGTFDLRADEVAAGAANENAAVAEEEDRWRATIPAAEAKQKIRYWVCGVGESGETRSEAFDYGVAYWREATSVEINVRSIAYRFGGAKNQLFLHWQSKREGVEMEWSRTPRPTPAGVALAPKETPWVMFNRQGCLTVKRRDEVLLQEAKPTEFLFAADGTLLRVRHTFAAADDEAFFGLGERYNALNQRGERLDVRVYEQYKGQGKRTYMPVPLLHTSRGYSLHLHTERWSAFDLAAASPDEWQVDAELDSAEGIAFSLYVGTLGENLRAYCERMGFPALPPDWTFGLWASSNDWDSQQHVMDEVRQMQEHDIHASAIVLEAWSDEINFYIWNNAEYAPCAGGDAPHLADFTFPPQGKWPNPKAMIDELHARGIRLLLWQIPVLKYPTETALMGNPQHDADEAYMLANRLAVLMPDGSPYRVRPPWFRGSLLPDFTNPAACAWWFAKRRYLVEEMGVDGFKTDGGEHLWGKEAIFADGRSGAELWNAYPAEYTRAYTDFLHKVRGKDALLFSRAGFAGSQNYPAHWAGDEVSTWEAYRASILGMLNAGLSGIPFIGWDIAGFSGPIPTAELYLRAAAMSVFCPIMQYHSEYWRGTPSRDRSPWNMQTCTGDERIIPLFRRFVAWRNQLRPYILEQAQKCATTGAPLMRALPIDFPNDARVLEHPLQFMFGESILVAPVTAPDAKTMMVYLPAGETWVDLWSGAQMEGGTSIEVETPIDRIPLYLRAAHTNPLAGIV
jgi:alpha-glucosidase (family GH31 glycosyl hydrolase)